MFTRKALPYLFLLIVLVGLSYALRAATPAGEITGTVSDKKTGDPIIGASVQMVGTTKGTLTDFEGKFTIGNVEPGVYTLKFSQVGYNSLEIDSVQVISGDGINIECSLEPSSTMIGTTIKVTARKDIIDKFEIASNVTISREKNKSRSTTTVEEMLKQVQGLVETESGEIYVRGGRTGEADALADSAPITSSGGADKKMAPSVAQAIGKACLPLRQDGHVGYPPAHGGSAIVNGEAFDAMFFKNYGVNPFVDTEDDHFSTFAVDVDDASYVLTRSYFERGYLPPEDAVRVEEFVNHFNYGYRAPHHQPFDVYVEGSPSRFGQNSYLLRIGIKGKEIDERDRKPANLTFVIDVSGSMGREDRLGLVKQALRLLVDHLKPEDRVGIVIYGSVGQDLLQPTSVRHRTRILEAIDMLQCGGSTYAEQGIRFGYRMADRMFDPSKINRVILCSDGVANVGQTGAEAILKEITHYAARGITLSAIGFGMGNYNDILLEKLGNKGNGYYAYVDDIDEARRIFIDNLTGSLQVIARDVKIQVDFDPRVVRSYRLLGYENRDVADQDFRNDTVDGGEIGSGHSVTALYEVKLQDRTGGRDLGKLFIRYKKPDYAAVYDKRYVHPEEDVYDDEHYADDYPGPFEVDELNFALNQNMINGDFAATTPQFRLAACAAEFAEILRGSYWAKDANLDELVSIARHACNQIQSNETDEFMHLLTKAVRLRQELADK